MPIESNKKEFFGEIYDGFEYTYKDSPVLNEFKEALREKGMIILHGVSQTGKSFLAKQMLLRLTKGKLENIELVRFTEVFSKDEFQLVSKVPDYIQPSLDYQLLGGNISEIIRKAQTYKQENFFLFLDDIPNTEANNILKFVFQVMDSIQDKEQRLPNFFVVGTINGLIR